MSSKKNLKKITGGRIMYVVKEKCRGCGAEYKERLYPDEYEQYMVGQRKMYCVKCQESGKFNNEEQYRFDIEKIGEWDDLM